jgi:hypothetical protein
MVCGAALACKSGLAGRLDFRPAAEAASYAADQQAERTCAQPDDLHTRVEDDANEDRPGERDQDEVLDRSGKATPASRRRCCVQIERGAMKGNCRCVTIESAHRSSPAVAQQARPKVFLPNQFYIEHFYLSARTALTLHSPRHLRAGSGSSRPIRDRDMVVAEERDDPVVEDESVGIPGQWPICLEIIRERRGNVSELYLGILGIKSEPAAARSTSAIAAISVPFNRMVTVPPSWTIRKSCHAPSTKPSSPDAKNRCPPG